MNERDDDVTPAPLGAYAAGLMRRRDDRARRKGKIGIDETEKRWIGADFEWADRAMAAAIEEIATLTDFEADFAGQLATRLGKYGRRTMMSGRQLEKARELARKLGVPFEEEGGRRSPLRDRR